MAEQLHSLEGLQLVTVYRHIKKGGVLAMQFKFYGGDNLRQGCCKLSEVCQIIGLEFKRVLAMGLRPEYIPYSRKYYPRGEQCQFNFNCPAKDKRKYKYGNSKR